MVLTRFHAAYDFVSPIMLGLCIYSLLDYFPMGIEISKRTRHRIWIGLITGLYRLDISASSMAIKVAAPVLLLVLPFAARDLEWYELDQNLFMAKRLRISA